MDTHVPTDTVREALLFSAKVRQPLSVPIAEKEAQYAMRMYFDSRWLTLGRSVGS